MEDCLLWSSVTVVMLYSGGNSVRLDIFTDTKAQRTYLVLPRYYKGGDVADLYPQALGCSFLVDFVRE